MSTTVDERVVSMEFDNRHFEKNVSTTLSTLDKLKQSLNLTGAAKGFEEINTAASRVNMSGLSSGVEAVQAKFSAMQVMAVTALANITNSAVNAGKRIVSALTIDPIKTGFQEYETQINAVQTILANTESKGTTLDDVNSALDTLNEYADKTIYNFTQMTRNIGTFTAAGVDLETSVSAIQGIANLAAVSGSTSQQASTAMYQLSQALASGRVKLQDWNSVVNAGMGGQVFQDALKRTAKVMGTDVDALIKKYGSFRDSLTQGDWLSTEVLTKTLEQFTMAAEEGSEEWEKFKKSLISDGYTEKQAEEILKMANTATDAATKVKTFTQLWDTLKEAAQSGWTQTWEILVGDFEEAKELLTSISDVVGGFINNMSKSRNELLEGALGSKWSKFTKQIEKAGVSTDKFTEKLKETGKKHGVVIDDLIEEHGSLRKVIDKGLLPAEIFRETLDSMIGSEETATESLNKLNGKVIEFEEVIRKVVRGDFGNAEDGYKKLAEAGYDVAFVQELINKHWVDGELDLTNMTVAQLQSMGYTQKQAEELKKLSAQTGKTRKSMNELMNAMTRTTGRELILESLSHILEQLKKPLVAIKEAWETIFPKTTEDQLYSVIEKFKELAMNFEITEEQANNFKKIFEGLFAALDASNWIITGSLSTSLRLLNNLLKLFGTDIFTVAGIIADYMIKFRDWVKEHTIFMGMIDKVSNVIYTFVLGLHDCIQAFLGLNSVKSIFSKLGTSIGELFGIASDGFENLNIDAFCAKLAEAFDIIESWIKGLDNTGLFKSIVTAVTGLIGLISSGIKFLIADADVLGSIVDGITALLSNTIDKIKEFNNEASATFEEGKYKGVLGIIEGVLDLILLIGEKIGKCITGITQGLAEAFGVDLMEILNAGLFGGLLLTINRFLTKLDGKSMIEDLKDGLFGSVKALFTDIKKVFGSVLETLETVRKALVTWQQSIQAGILMKIATAIALLAASLLVISVIPADEMEQTLGALTVLLVELMASLVVFSKLNLKGINAVAKAISLMVGVSVGIWILASALKKLADFKFEQLMLGLFGIGVLMSELGVFLSTVKIDKQVGKSAGAILVISAALWVLSKAVESFGGMSNEEMARGLFAIAAGLAAFVLALRYLPKDTTTSLTKITGISKVSEKANLVSAGLAFIAFAAAMKIFASAMADFALLEWDEIGRGLVVLASAVGAFVVAMKLMPKDISGNMVGIGIGMIGMSTALLIMAKVINEIKDVKWTSLVKTIGSIYVLLYALAGALNMMTGTVGGAAALLVAAGALALIVPVLHALGEMKIGKLIKSLAALALVFGVIAAAAELLQPLLPAILSLAGAMALIGLATVGVGAGLMMIGAGITAIAGSLAAGVGSIVASIAMIIMGIVELIPAIAKGLAEGFIAIVVGIADSAEVLVDSVLTMILELVSSLAEHTPKIADALFDFVIGLLRSLTNKLPDLIVVAVDLIMAFFRGVGDALSGIDVEGLVKGVAGVGLLAGLMWLLGTVVGLIPNAIVGVLGMGVVIAELALVLAAVGAIAQIPGLKWLINEGGEFLQTIGNALGKFIGGIIGGVGEGITASLPKMADDLSKFMENLGPFIEGAKELKAADVMSSVTSLAEAILILTGANFIDGITRFIGGGTSLATFGEELATFGESLGTFVDKLGIFDDTKAKSCTNAANVIKAFAEASKEVDGQSDLSKSIFGDNSIAAFGEQLPALGENLGKFASNLGTFNDGTKGTITAALEALAYMVTIAQNISGQYTFTDGLAFFVEGMVGIGENLKSFSEKLGVFSKEQLTSIQNAVSALREFETLVGSDMVSLTEAIPGFCNVLPGLASELTAFCAGIPAGETVKKAIDSLKSVVSSVVEISNANVNAVSEFATSFSKLGETGVTEFVSQFSNSTNKSDVKKAAEALVDKAVEGAESKRAIFKDAFTSIVQSANTAMKTNKIYESFMSVGEYLAEGFANGIDSKDSKFKADVAARALANAAKHAAQSELNEHSPSKVFYEIGAFAGEGFINALLDYSSKAYTASSKMASSARSGLTKAISKISEMIDSDLDTQPTIRPVLDLSDVSAGAGAINGMLSMSPSIGVLSNAGTISSMMNHRIQNGGNSDIISAIKDLKDTFNNASGNTYNVNGITYDDGSNITNAVKSLVRAAKVERRI